MTQIYSSPPITEAVLELKFQETIANEVVDKISRRLSKFYVFTDPDEGVNIFVDAQSGSSTRQALWHGVRHSSLDRSDVSSIRSISLLFSRLAPYQGWSDFIAKAQRDWDVVRRSTQALSLSRVGLRFINRLDIPDTKTTESRMSDYLNIFPVMPDTKFGPLTGYLMQVTRPYGEDGFNVIINTAIGPSPLVSHSSLYLDIDVSLESRLPRRDEDIWSLTSRLRDCKNDVFENCITDQTREMIRR